jgi:hypothetical protein
VEGLILGGTDSILASSLVPHAVKITSVAAAVQIAALIIFLGAKSVTCTHASSAREVLVEIQIQSVLSKGLNAWSQKGGRRKRKLCGNCSKRKS